MFLRVGLKAFKGYKLWCKQCFHRPSWGPCLWGEEPADSHRLRSAFIPRTANTSSERGEESRKKNIEFINATGYNCERSSDQSIEVDWFKFKVQQGLWSFNSNINSALFISKVSYILAMFYFNGWQAAYGMKKGLSVFFRWACLSFTRCNKSPTCHFPTYIFSAFFLTSQMAWRDLVILLKRLSSFPHP